MNDKIERPSAWAHQSVTGRFPSGTDVRTAIRAVTEVAHERTDGTNALPWWLRSDAVFWHGTGNAWTPRKGGLVLPPSETGVLPVVDSDRTAVYVTASRLDAICYAMRHDRPVVLRCVVEREPQPDDCLPDSDDSWRVPWARIVRCESISRTELADAGGRIAAAAAQAQLRVIREAAGIPEPDEP